MRNVALAVWLLGSFVGVGLGLVACSDKGDSDSSNAGEKGISSKGQNLTQCGNVVCRAGRECCNESCGICTERDVECSAQICKPGDGVSALAPACGGKSQRPCPGDGHCVDDDGKTCASDDADCGGTCECPKSAECPEGSSWNANPQLCGCELDDDSGSSGSSGGVHGSSRDGGNDDGSGSGGASGDAGTIGGDRCGDVTCASGQACCNDSCGICAPPGAACTQQVCEPIGGAGGDGGSGSDAGSGGSGGSGGSSAAGSGGSGGMSGSGGSGTGGSAGSAGSSGSGGSAGSSPPPVQCGSTACPAGDVCCDPACGLCAPDNALCVQSSCSDPGPHPGDTCDMPCASNERCEYVAVTCVVAPCLPQPECVPFVACGGKTGAPCPGTGSCVDDTSDTCDPQNGGADCTGKCVCDQRILHTCKLDYRFNYSPSVCACVYDPIQCLPESPACTQ